MEKNPKCINCGCKLSFPAGGGADSYAIGFEMENTKLCAGCIREAKKTNKKTNKKIMSVDVETNGLYGQPFAIGAVLFNNGETTEEFTARCPCPINMNEWVKDNVLPALTNMPETHPNYHTMVEAFYSWYMTHKEGAVIIAHIAHPVETGLFRDMIKAAPGRDFNGPYPFIDVASVLLAKGFDPLSVDQYILKKKLSVPPESPHHPLYDAHAALAVYIHLMGYKN
jgi:DNA polymerase III alpha subunit (gram-positive type)